jgi:hypothetical protein
MSQEATSQWYALGLEVGDSLCVPPWELIDTAVVGLKSHLQDNTIQALWRYTLAYLMLLAAKSATEDDADSQRFCYAFSEGMMDGLERSTARIPCPVPNVRETALQLWKEIQDHEEQMEKRPLSDAEQIAEYLTPFLMRCFGVTITVWMRLLMKNTSNPSRTGSVMLQAARTRMVSVFKLSRDLKQKLAKNGASPTDPEADITANRDGSEFPVGGGVWVSTDGGETWSDRTIEPDGECPMNANPLSPLPPRLREQLESLRALGAAIWERHKQSEKDWTSALTIDASNAICRSGFNWYEIGRSRASGVPDEQVVNLYYALIQKEAPFVRKKDFRRRWAILMLLCFDMVAMSRYNNREDATACREGIISVAAKKLKPLLAFRIPEREGIAATWQRYAEHLRDETQPLDLGTHTTWRRSSFSNSKLTAPTGICHF